MARRLLCLASCLGSLFRINYRKRDEEARNCEVSLLHEKTIRTSERTTFSGIRRASHRDSNPANNEDEGDQSLNV